MAEWIPETPARWNADKARMIGDIAPRLFGLGEPSEGDSLGDEWWRVEDGGEVVGYGRLDDTWGDAEILLFVAPDRRSSGYGAFILKHLEQEAVARGLNYIYNVVPRRHPEPDTVTAWFVARGFEPTPTGELRKHVR